MDSDNGLQVAVLHSYKDISVSEFLLHDLTIHQKISPLYVASLPFMSRWVPVATLYYLLHGGSEVHHYDVIDHDSLKSCHLGSCLYAPSPPPTLSVDFYIFIPKDTLS